MSSNAPIPENDDQEDAEFGGTRLFEPGISFSRQEQDIALAAEMLESGVLNQRQLVAAISDWSIHGNESLADHIEQRQLLLSEQIAMLQRRALNRANLARQSAVGESEAPSAGDSLLAATMERLDGTGRVAKLLGITVAAGGGENDQRLSHARYQFVRKIGQGGLGRVWLARDLNLNRHVALKEISHPSRATESLIARFRREAEITGRLEHPGIVPIYYLGDDVETQRAFYTMRFLGKKTLQDSIDEYHERREAGDDDPMLLRHLLTAFVSICHALGHAHSRKVVHRDLKPENVVIDSFGQVIVIDWGLAKVMDDTAVESLVDVMATDTVDRTTDGQVLGTPLYMAPEQASGRLDEVDHRTDIYGLGAILFAIITGYAPHEKTRRASVDSGVGARGLISAVAGGETPLASELNAKADPALDAICGKAMARRRYARYQAAGDLAEDVQRWMAGERVTAFTESSLRRARRWIARHQGLSQTLAALAMIVIVAMTTLAMAARQQNIATEQARFAQMQGDFREVELHLQTAARELAKDARFIASLPPIQGIVNARAGIEGDDEAVWQTRLDSIFTGLLRSNASYLSLSFNARENNAEIVRVERNPADPSVVRVLPTSRLYQAATDDLMEQVSRQEPGDVRISLETRPRYASLPETVKRVSVATPIYSDVGGDCFGMAIIEADLFQQVQEVLVNLAGVECEIFVADGRGNLVASAQPQQGVRAAAPSENIANLPREIAVLLSEDNMPFEVTKPGNFIAKRFYLDPQGRGLLIFARLPGER